MVFDIKAAHSSEPDKTFRIEAESEREAVRIVKEQGFHPFSVTEINSAEPAESNAVPTSSQSHDTNPINAQIAPILQQINRIIVGKERQVKLAVACLISGGHLLIDDIPGVGKTTFSHALAKSCGLNYKRVQFTSDLLPSDILGVSVFDQPTSSFRFHKGAIFTHVLLADEINRASAKTQSALLEAMEEQQVTIDGDSYSLPNPFFIIATQNPLEHMGTNPLPESQIDRFSIRIVLGYPEMSVERRLWQGKSGRAQIDQLEPLIDCEELQQLQSQVDSIFTSDALLDYLEVIVNFTRSCGHYVNGLSPRAALVLLKVTRAWAMLHGRDYATPEDMKTVLPFVAAHRLQSVDAVKSIQDVHDELLKIEIP